MARAQRPGRGPSVPWQPTRPSRGEQKPRLPAVTAAVGRHPDGRRRRGRRLRARRQGGQRAESELGSRTPVGTRLPGRGPALLSGSLDLGGALVGVERGAAGLSPPAEHHGAAATLSRRNQRGWRRWEVRYGTGTKRGWEACAYAGPAGTVALGSDEPRAQIRSLPLASFVPRTGLRFFISNREQRTSTSGCFSREKNGTNCA